MISPRHLVYYDSGDGYAALIAAALRLGLLPRSERPASGRIASLLREHALDKAAGDVHLLGANGGERVYWCGLGRSATAVVLAWRHFLKLYGQAQELFFLYDVPEPKRWKWRRGRKRREWQLLGEAAIREYAAFLTILMGKLPEDRIPTQAEVLALPDYDQAESWQLGTLFYKGDDERGQPVYTIGFGPEQAQAKRAVLSLLEQVDLDTRDLLLCHALPQINRWAKIGGALSRRYGLVSIGRPLSAYGIRRDYDRLVRFVRGVKEEEARRIRS